MGMIIINKEKETPTIYFLGMQYVFHMFIVEFYVSLFLNVKLITSKMKFSGEKNHDSLVFRMFVEDGVTSGWLRPFDMLVCNNAAIHEKSYNCDLADFLWNRPGLDGEPLCILLLPLPTPSPDLNPIELI